MNEFLHYAFFKIGAFSLTVLSVLLFAGFILVVLIVLQIAKRLLDRSKRMDAAKRYSIFRLIKYFIWIFATLIGLQILGMNISVLLAGSAALLVGLGLGLQNIFADFVSGVILLADATIKVNDIIEVNKIVCQVQSINLRTTTVLTRDDKYIVLPNNELTKNSIINWTHRAIASRFQLQVGVSYASDTALVMKILLQAGQDQKGILPFPAPFVRFTEFGDSALEFTLYFFSEEVFRVENLQSELRLRILADFRANGIQIPFPQRVIHNA